MKSCVFCGKETTTHRCRSCGEDTCRDCASKHRTPDQWECLACERERKEFQGMLESEHWDD